MEKWGSAFSFLERCCIVIRVVCGRLQDSLLLHGGEQGTGLDIGVGALALHVLRRPLVSVAVSWYPNSHPRSPATRELMFHDMATMAESAS